MPLMCPNVSIALFRMFGYVNLSRKRIYPRQEMNDATDSWPAQLNMDTTYDEDLCENKFFQELQSQHQPLFEQIIHEGWIICVPRSGSMPEDGLTTEYITGHILIPSHNMPVTKFQTLSGKEVKLDNKLLTVEYEIAKTRCAHILFEETFYNKDLCKYRVWCIECPLEAGLPVADNGLTTVTNLHDAVNLLWNGLVEKNLMKELECAIEEFQYIHNDLENRPLQIQKDLVNSLYAKGLETVLKDVGLKDKVSLSRHFSQNVKISVETFILNGLRVILPRSVRASVASEDAHLNKIIRNVREVQLKDLAIRGDLYDGIHRGKLELARLDRYFTVLEKVECLKKAIRYVSEGASAVSSDDLLPVLIFLIIKTGLPNWMAQLAFMKQFRFSVNSCHEADEAGFLITSMEAAVDYIKSGVLLESSSAEGSNKEDILQSYKSGRIHEDTSLSYLFSCIKKGDLHEVKKILSANVLTTPWHSKLCHPLCTCETCEKSVSNYLHLHQPTVNSKDDCGLTCLHVAALYGQVTIVDFLLNTKANPNGVDADGITPLHCASARGHQNTVLLLLHANGDPKLADIRCNTPLHLAADHGHEGCVKALLYFAEQMRLLLDPNSSNINGDTPLHHASRWGYSDIVEILLEYGASCNIKNKRGQTPLTVAHSKHVLEILEQAASNIQENHSSISHEIEQSCHSAFASLKMLQTPNQLESKHSNNVALRHTIDKLLSAIAAGDIRLAYYYLGLGDQTDCTHTRTNFCHPLCDCENCAPPEEFFEKLHNSPTLAINACNSNNETALHVASSTGCTEIVQLLLDAGANVNVVTKSGGHTPLHLACSASRLNVVKLLLHCATCNIDIKDHNGDTPLHIAAKTGNAKILECLLRCGADTKLRNVQGVTALQEVEKKLSYGTSSFAYSEALKIFKRNSVQSINI